MLNDLFTEAQRICLPILSRHSDESDAAHDISHLYRVAKTCRKICATEPSADALVVFIAAFLHDLVNVPKNSPDRTKASLFSADLAIKELEALSILSQQQLETLHSTIETHSFSLGKEPTCIEGYILRDSDRLDAIGAIGVARCFATGPRMGAKLYDWADPKAHHRDLDDKSFSIDHFFTKLFTLSEGMHTEEGKRLAKQRHDFMQSFVDQFFDEV